MEEYLKIKEDFIQRWGELAASWGVSKAMGQVQALLLMSSEPICSGKIMEELSLSTGSVNKTTRALCDWGLVHRVQQEGERKDYFVAEKDSLKMFRAVVEQRKKREFDPMIELLEEMSNIEPKCEKSEEFHSTMGQLLHFSNSAAEALERLCSCQPKWIYNSYMKDEKRCC